MGPGVVPYLLIIHSVLKMASVRFGAGIVDARGSISGQVFSRNANGAYIRARTAPTQPNTPAQTAQRIQFGSRSSSFATLTDAQVEAWDAAAKGELGAYTNRLGIPSQYTGAQLYNSLNGILDALGEARISDPPAVAMLPEFEAATFGIEYSAAGETYAQTGTAQIFGAADWGTLVEVGTSQSMGKLATSSVPYKLADAAIDISGSGLGARLMEAVDTYIPTPERPSVKVIFLKVRVVDQTSGQASSPLSLRVPVTFVA